MRVFDTLRLNRPMKKIVCKMLIGFKISSFILYYTPINFTIEESSPKWKAVEVDKDFIVDSFSRPITFLKANSSYAFKLAPVVDTSVGQPSAIAQLSTAANVPPQPAQIRLENLTAENVVVAWNRTMDIDGPDPGHYNVYIKEAGQVIEQILPGVLAYDRIQLELKPATKYSVRIAAIGPGGPSPKTSAITFETMASLNVTTTPRELKVPTTTQISEFGQKTAAFTPGPSFIMTEELTARTTLNGEEQITPSTLSTARSPAGFEDITRGVVTHAASTVNRIDRLRSRLPIDQLKLYTDALESCDAVGGSMLPTDVVFVVDMSNHPNRIDYNLIVDGITKIITILSDYRVPQTNERTRDENIDQLFDILKNTDHLTGYSRYRIPDAILEARDILGEPGSRKSARKIILLVTDGEYPVDEMKAAIDELTHHNVSILVIGVGPGADDVRTLTPRDDDGISRNTFLARTAVHFDKNVAPEVIRRICSLEPPAPFTKPDVPELQKAQSKVSIIKAQFSGPSEIEMEWTVENIQPDNIKGFEVSYVDVKESLERKIPVNGQARALTLSDVTPEDYVVTVKAVSVLPNETVTSMPVTIKKPPPSPFTESTTGRYSVDVDSRPVTPYSVFSSTIPPSQVQVVPKCNCTCQLSIKIKRGRCFYEDDGVDGMSATGSNEITVDLDEILRGRSTRANCSRNGEGRNSVSAEQRTNAPEILHHENPVPKEKEFECPCVLPVYGEVCPPGYSFKSGKCRGKCDS
uniref:Uncharacterized protein n=1 Tax=Romanomermis culicivorax TaxID=13658 RepID=A0A915IHZ5_ROMCU